MANGYKQGRINEEVKRELALIIRDVKDPRIPPMTSVVHAQVSPDLKYAKAFVSILGDYDEKEVRKGLKACKGYMRSQLGQRLSLRNVPELTFEFDKSVEMGARIDKILREIEKSGEDGEQ